MSDSPFVGPRPFEKEDSDRFFGRTRETEELLSLIIAHRAVLVYAQSGAGKSSLLRAGVIKRLEDQQYQVCDPHASMAYCQMMFHPRACKTFLFTMPSVLGGNIAERPISQRSCEDHVV
jgi:hypothetical protein